MKLLIKATDLSLEILVSLIFSEVPGSEQLQACSFYEPGGSTRSTSNRQTNHCPHIPGKIPWSPYTVSNSESLTPLIRLFFLIREGGGCTQAIDGVVDDVDDDGVGVGDSDGDACGVGDGDSYSDGFGCGDGVDDDDEGVGDGDGNGDTDGDGDSKQ